jgi:hypothetical protein
VNEEQESDYAISIFRTTVNYLDMKEIEQHVILYAALTITISICNVQRVPPEEVKRMLEAALYSYAEQWTPNQVDN